MLSGFQIAFSCSVVKQVAQSLSGFTRTDSPSNATVNSMKSMPLAVAASRSESLIGREASEMTVSPVVNFLKPPPVPEMPTGICTAGWSLRKSSAAATVTG